MDWSELVVLDRDNHPLAVAGLCGFFYFNRSVHKIAHAVAEGMERYVAYVGPDALSVYSAASGRWKPWTPRQLGKDLRLLRSFPADHEGAHIDYDSDPVPGAYGVALAASMLDAETEAKWANIMRVDLPATALDDRPIEEILTFFQTLIEAMEPDSASAGFAFKRTEGTMQYAKLGVHARLPRFLGFDPCYSLIRYRMRGHTFSAHWLNFVGPWLAERLGGAETIVEALPACEVRTLKCGVLIRGAELPPVGDTNRGARDLGCLPDVARLLKPTRVSLSAFGEPNFDASAWLARFDDMPSRPWSNRGLS